MSTPIYLAPPRGKADELNQLKERGIGHLMPGELDDIDIQVQSEQPGNLHKMNFENLAALCQAQLTNGPVRGDPTLFYNAFKAIEVFSYIFNVPVMAVYLPNINEEQKSSLAAYAMTDFTTKKDRYTGTPTAPHYALINKMRPVTAEPPAGYVSFHSYLSWQHALRGIHIFSTVSQHAASQILFNIITSKAKVTEFNADANHEYGCARITNGVEKIKSLLKPGEVMVSEGFTPVMVGWDNTRTIKGKHTSVAVQDLHLLPGHYFAYFDGLTAPDHKFQDLHGLPQLRQERYIGLLSQYPSYLGSGTALTTDRVTVGLSIFGANAPSFSYGNPKDDHPTFQLPKDLLAKDLNMEKGPDGKLKLPYLPLALQPIMTASIQISEAFKSGEIILSPPPKRSAGFTNQNAIQFKISGDPAFTQSYIAIKQISSDLRNARAPKRKQKEDGNLKTCGKKEKIETDAFDDVL